MILLDRCIPGIIRWLVYTAAHSRVLTLASQEISIVYGMEAHI